MKLLREIQPGVWNYKLYEARALLKSIRYWQSVCVNPTLAKRPIAYYKNQMKEWPPEKLAVINQIAGYTEIQAHDEFLYNGEVFECLGRDEGLVWYDDYLRGRCAELLSADPGDCKLV